MTPKKEAALQTMLTAAHGDYSKGLSIRAFLRINDRATSEDLVQDTFLKTWRYLVKGGKINMMKAFLYHILNNLIVDEYRKHKTTSLDVLIEKGFEPSSDESEHVFNISDGKIATILIARLPLKYQKVMRMRYVQLLSLEEMSLITGQSRNTMAVQTHRGLSKLKILFEQQN